MIGRTEVPGALEDRLGDTMNSMFCHEENKSQLDDDQVTTHIGIKLDGLSKVLGLNPYDKRGHCCGKLKSVSEQDIQLVHVICPQSFECEAMDCQPHAILKKTQEYHTSRVTLVKGTKIYDKVPVLAGHCPKCKAIYYADHEHFVDERLVDRVFSGAVLNGSYHFHASFSAFMEFWNDSFQSTQYTTSRKFSQRQVWQAFV